MRNEVIENAVITVNETSLSVREWNNRRVVTFADIDEVHEKADGTAKRTFIKYKEYLTAGRDYYVVKPSDFEKYATCTLGFNRSSIPNRGLTLITESGYLMITKPISGEKAWEVQRDLVNSYFKLKEVSYNMSEELPVNTQLLNQFVSQLTNGFQTIVTQMDNRYEAMFEEFKNIIENQEQKKLSTKKECKVSVVKVIDPIRDTIKPLAELYGDKSVGYNNTYRKVYYAMGVDWKYRKTRYKNSKGNKNKPSKIYLLESDSKLLSKFKITVSKLIAEATEDTTNA